MGTFSPHLLHVWLVPAGFTTTTTSLFRFGGQNRQELVPAGISNTLRQAGMTHHVLDAQALDSHRPVGVHDLACFLMVEGPALVADGAVRFGDQELGPPSVLRMPRGGPPPPPRRTNVYIDSWNLYFGCLKGTPYRWINVAEMARLSLPAHFHINRIRFFTARVQARPADLQQAVRQETLFRALRTLPNLTMHYGTFLVSHPRMPLVTPLPDGTRFVNVIKTEEKGSDVNLATHLLVDAFDGDFDAAVIVSDDSDLVEPLQIVRQKFGRHVTVLSPRGKSRELSRVATRFRQIQIAVLQASQFPPTLTDANGSFTKPASW